MNTITIQVEDRNVMSGLIKVLKTMNGVVFYLLIKTRSQAWKKQWMIFAMEE